MPVSFTPHHGLSSPKLGFDAAKQAAEPQVVTSTKRWFWMSADDTPEAEPSETEPVKDAGRDWGARVRGWATQVGDWLDALLPAPSPPPVLMPIPVRTRRRRR